MHWRLEGSQLIFLQTKPGDMVSNEYCIMSIMIMTR